MTHLTHRGWRIEPCEFRPNYWTATGPDYDASTDGGEGDWIDNGHRVEARGFDELLSEIDGWISDNEPRVRPSPATTCIEHFHEGDPAPQRLSFQIKVF